MLKAFLIALIAVCGGFSALATTDIQPNGNLAGGDSAANCTQPVLGTYSGNANFEAKWRANTVPLRWYNNNTLMEDTESVSNTCTYDGSLTIPQTPPTRIGYNFAGWHVRPRYDFSTIPVNATREKRWMREKLSTVCRYGDPETYMSGGNAVEVPCYNAGFSDLEPRELKVQFTHGTIYGVSKCSTNGGTFAAAGTPNNTDGQYCWCKVTGYRPLTNNPENILYASLVVLSWIYGTDYSTVNNCNSACAHYCGNAIYTNTNFRSAVFSAAQQ